VVISQRSLAIAFCFFSFCEIFLMDMNLRMNTNNLFFLLLFGRKMAGYLPFYLGRTKEA
jgi:hypothetical protein